MRIKREGRWLVVSFDSLHTCLSWAVWGGGRKTAQKIAWYQVGKEELAPPADPRDYLGKCLRERGLVDAVGMMTSASLEDYTKSSKNESGLEVNTVATVGLGNALRVGDPPGGNRVGTVNLLCALSVPLTEEAQLEALSLAIEARTAAILDASILSTRSGLPATGTGTDCVVMACPLVQDAPPLQFAGKHTRVGSLIGSSVYEAVAAGAGRWNQIQRKEVLA